MLEKHFSPLKYMKKVTQKQFDFFKQECQKWIEHFELNNYRVDFCLKKLKGNRAEINVNSFYVSTITLTAEWDDRIVDISDGVLAESAKHEVFHLLLGRFSGYAWKRFASKNEMLEAEEELVQKLSKLIN